MSLENITPALDQWHRSTIIPFDNMNTKPIQDGMLTHNALIKGLANIILHKEIENYFCFTELTLTDLNLENIDIIGEYISLRKLILCRNSINDLSALNNLNELEHLDVSFNRLNQILNFNPPKMLYYVNCSHNNIEYVDDLTSFWSLVHLDLSHNSIENIKGIQNLQYLKFLNLSYNCIKKINYSLPCALVEINLAHNCITDLRLNMSLSMCEILDVSHNQLKYLNFLKNAKNLSVLNIQHNMIVDVSQLEYCRILPNLHTLNAENNEFIKLNIHEQMFSNNLPLKSNTDQIFMKTEDFQEFNNIEIHPIVMAKKNAIKSTVLEHLSGKPPISGNKCDSYNLYTLPMVILVGSPKTGKKYFLNEIFSKHSDKFYRAFIYTTDNACKNKIFQTITAQEFTRKNCTGEFVFSYQYLGHSYGLGEDQLLKCVHENKILITFTNLEEALCLKLKGYNPVFILMMPEDKLFYEKKVYQSLDKYMKQRSRLTKNEAFIKNGTTEQILNIMNINNCPENDETNVLNVCLSDSKNKFNDDTLLQINSQNTDLIEIDYDDLILNNPSMVFANECLNNLNICYNLYEKNTDIFHSLVYVDNFESASKEITTIMINVYKKYQIDHKTETQMLQNKRLIEHIQKRNEQLCNDI